ncbi:sigma-70 family RNA polymerase sigma factor [Actinomycetospora endophytica]|uniref:Sigma-70 family RNA polymerase sigma factor n=1 Tax=Actinomycetospora endophytica TaxID=2291215 RepID=A0ABS8P6E2_9PSEU|nr:sigma-70 family RNA polymerase sigma factor [Actinomycetospora endophytica]MCD2193588.1 sigma-70 family RNA polymerase sigma factor [Actinomycetospora endophytica]
MARRTVAVAPMVRAMCANRLRGNGSEDAAQSVLEAVWRAQHRQEFASEEAVRRYAAVVARVRLPYDDRRSVRAAPTSDVSEHLWAGDAGEEPEARYERTEAVAEAAQRVVELMGRLSDREREVIAATKLGGLTKAEAAAQLGLKPSGVKSAQRRAVAKMRQSEDPRTARPAAADERANEPGNGAGEKLERRRVARAAATDQLPEGPVAHAAAGAARGFEAEHGRLPSRTELVALTGAGAGTAGRVVRALREQDGARYEVTTPVRNQTVAAAAQFAAEHGRRPRPVELARAAETSEQTARHVLRGLARQQRDTRAGDAAGGRGWPSPLSDRAERAARELRERDGSWPDWRAVSEAAQVGRTTAAGVLRELKAHTSDHATDHGDDRDEAAPARAQAGSPLVEHPLVAQLGSQHPPDALHAQPPEHNTDQKGSTSAGRSGEDSQAGGPTSEAEPDPVSVAGTAVEAAALRVAGTNEAATADSAAAESPRARRDQLARWHTDDHGQSYTAAVGQAAASDAGT